MTTTIDIPDEMIEQAMRVTGAASAQTAVLKALEEFISRHDQRSLVPLLGTLDDFMTPEELDEMRRTD